MIHLPGSRNHEGPRRRYAVHDVWRRQIVPVRVVERPLEAGRAGRSSTLWGRACAGLRAPWLRAAVDGAGQESTGRSGVPEVVVEGGRQTY